MKKFERNVMGETRFSTRTLASFKRGEKKCHTRATKRYEQEEGCKSTKEMYRKFEVVDVYAWLYYALK